MGRKSAELLINMIESKRPTNQFETVVFASELHQRNSSRVMVNG
jgi:hypothetical protein